MKMNKRHAILGLVLAGSLIAAWFAPPMEPGVVAPTAMARADGSRNPAGGNSLVRSEDGGRVLGIRSRTPDEELAPAFVTHSWSPPASKAVITPKVEAPAPVAPPLPFKFMGRYVDGGQIMVFLLQGDRSVVTKVGDVIDGIYQVDDINGGAMTFIYLPLEQKQTLALGDSN